MESLIVSPLVEVLFVRLTDSVLGQVGSRREFKMEMEKMKETLSVIQAVIEDAEEQQRKNKNVRTWLSKLKDIAVDADDLLNEVATLTLRKNLMETYRSYPDPRDFLTKLVDAQEDFTGGSIRTLFHLGVRNVDVRMESMINKRVRIYELIDPLWLRMQKGRLCGDLYDLHLSSWNVKMKDRIGMVVRKIGEGTRYGVNQTSLSVKSISTHRKQSRKLKETRTRLDDVAKEMSSFKFRETQFYGRSTTMEKRETGPFVNESKVYGREEDVDKIVGMLLSTSTSPDVEVIPIVGIGGMGKTTLAQLVYNCPRVTSHFQSLMWVSVNDHFNPARIINQILSYVREGSHDSFQIGVLQSQLRESLVGKRYLIVLDDVWNEDADEWDKVMNPLKGSGGSSKLILTTRSEAVAAITSTFPPFHLEPLRKEECWKLFKHRAFADGKEDDFPSLLDIGDQIVDKCKGVPLVANILGSMLRFKREVSEWLNVQRSELWSINAGENTIISIFRLSYNHLPSHLKACFAYCSVFPKNYVISKEKLIHQWLAHGLIPSVGDPSFRPEDIGNEYFNNLLMMSFFQETRKSDDTGMAEFKMHDLIHDLAKSVAGEEIMTLGQINGQCNISRTCHASVVCSSGYALIPEALCKAKRLRSLNFLSPREDYVAAIPTILATFKHLRMLNFSGSGINRLHQEIGGLTSLQYLDLSNTLLETMPATICDLCNLQTLNLSSCSELKELPSGITKLIKLRHLNIDDCPRLASMPPSMWHLRNLQTLPVYIIGRNFETSIFQLVAMEELRGKLKIKCLEEAIIPSGNSMVRKWMQAREFRSLELLWQNDVDKLDHNRMRQAHRHVDDQTDFVLVDSLTASPFIRMLSINGYSGTKFPDEMSWSRNLTELNIINCRRCESLPPLGELPVLKILHIQGMDSVVHIGVEFLGEGDRPFCSLKELYFTDFADLRSWSSIDSTEVFTCLEKLEIINCPFLVTMPWFPCLRDLKLRKCIQFDQMVIWSASELTTLSTLVIDSFPQLSFIPKKLLRNNFNLISLTVTSCPKVSTLPENLGSLRALKSLKIGWCDELDTFPSGLKYLTALENLEIVECPSIICLPEDGMEGLCSLRSFSIENCPSLAFLPMGMKYLTSLENLTVMFLKLVHLPEVLQYLLALRSLTIMSCPELRSLPAGLQHVQNLRILEIHSCPKLMEIPEWVEHLVSLRSLKISDCPEIEFLPKGLQCLGALQHLSIRDCPVLEKRCERGIGEDWQKISHIPYVYVGSSALQHSRDIASTSHNP
ncbi:putative disease resistance protein RGA3 [Argentina anserina]|uniref:putative disease resistance protein RGA3 n=1 Tax=Argentina anserina TaxID=57926 RepID=UPI00217621BD|nr:putative disease resistance protein RGA3 [Potentilla anserina]